MEIFVAGLLLLTGGVMDDSTGSISADPSALRWKHRILLICADSREDSSFTAQLEMLSVVPEELKERDLVTFHLIPDSSTFENRELARESHAELVERFEIRLDRFEVLLIGKDGTIKLRQTEPLSPGPLFELIDSMPMRKREMKAD